MNIFSARWKIDVPCFGGSATALACSHERSLSLFLSLSLSISLVEKFSTNHGRKRPTHIRQVGEINYDLVKGDDARATLGRRNYSAT